MFMVWCFRLEGFWFDAVQSSVGFVAAAAFRATGFSTPIFFDNALPVVL
jgi:hypothetical protein